ncbi:hypothetical protein QWA68_008037 [Fusarium oxysporum]|nr:hypothetical protein QWA68_008037 [Fusarium oxysporum]
MIHRHCMSNTIFSLITTSATGHSLSSLISISHKVTMNQQRTRPIQKFAKAVSQCSVEATAYGKCIVADYNAVHKDKCAKEFMRLKDCYLAASKKT